MTSGPNMSDTNPCKVIDLTVYRRRRYAEQIQKERAIYLAEVFARMETKEEKQDGRDEVRKD